MTSVNARTTVAAKRQELDAMIRTYMSFLVQGKASARSFISVEG